MREGDRIEIETLKIGRMILRKMIIFQQRDIYIQNILHLHTCMCMHVCIYGLVERNEGEESGRDWGRSG
jgi:hypothetical protein